MKNIRTILITALLWLGAAGAALAQQSSPNWSYGYTPTPAEWNHWFAVKTDWPGAASCTVTGCTLSGPLVTAPSTTLNTGFNVPPGTAPTTPNNGDIWMTTAGLFVGLNGGGWPLISAARPPGGRITLSANLPVMPVGVSGATTLRYDCAGSAAVYYWDGHADQQDNITNCELTDAMVSAASAGQVVSNDLFDLWWAHNGVNKICLAMSAAVGGGGGWKTDAGGGSITSRGTGYTQLDYSTRPYITNKNAITNCFNGANNYGTILANQGTYLGTVYSAGAGQVTYTPGGVASGGIAGLFGICNPFNQVSVAGATIDNGANYTYTTATIRQARASGGNQTSVVNCYQGLGNYDVHYNPAITTTATVAAIGTVCIGLDSPSTCASAKTFTYSQAAAVMQGSPTNTLRSGPTAGLHTFYANEVGDGTNANTFNAQSANQLTIYFMN